MARDEGVLVSISSDAHSVLELNNLKYGISQARRGWFSTDDVLNSRPLSELKRLFGQRFMADPENLRRAKELHFEPPLDEGIRETVEILIAHGVETCESCQGGEGHSYPEPTVRFEGQLSQGLSRLLNFA